MRKAIYLGAALAAVISTSCSNDMEQPVAAGGDGNVAIRLQLPKQFSTRAFGDGLTATRLQYAVYHSGENTPVITGDTEFTGLEATVNLNLVNGVTYDFVFWADKPENTFYTFDAAAQTVKVDYTRLAGSDETRDAFFGQLTGQSITGPTSLSATLKRPFAQINLGTSDFKEDAVKAAYGDNFTSSMTVSTKLPNTLDLITGDVSGEVETVATTSAAAPSGETFPVSGYDYVSMNYILVGSDKEVVDLSFSFSNDTKTVAELPVAMVPVQRNYRTNIYGAILTSPTDLKITIDPAFEDPDNNIEVKVVRSATELAASLEEGGMIEVPADVELDLRTVNDGAEIVLAPNTVLKVNGSINTSRAQLSVSEGTVTVDGEGKGKITSVGFDTGNRPLNVYDGATLIVKNLELETEQNNGGSVIYSDGGNLEVENIVINCHNFAIGANGGTFKAKNSVFNSDSNNKIGAHSYTVDVTNGCVAEIDNCEVNGIQGGISVGNEGSVVTINSGTFTTRSLEGYSGQTAFYPVYIFDKGVAVINGGDFISGCNYTIYNGNNDVPELYTWGNGACLKGGRYNKGTIDQNSKLTYPAAEGYEWIEIEGDEVFKFEVVKKN